MRSALALIIFLLLFTAACAETDTPPPRTESDTVATTYPSAAAGDTASIATVGDLTDDQKLMLVEEVPLGSTYEQVQQRFPNMGARQSEGSGATAHLSEATLDTEVLDRDAVIEFNFDEERLYSFYYRIDSLDCQEGEGLYGELQDFYTDYYGEGREEEEPEDGYTARSSYWRMGESQGGVALTLGRQAGVCRLGWGFQQPAPY